MKKTIGELVDELSIINIKIYMLEDNVEKHLNTIEEDWAKHDLIKRRSLLKSAINEYFGDKPEIKIYKK